MTPAAPTFWIDWLCRDALPLWSDAGYDSDEDSFVERLTLSGTPQADVPRRLMVQARQIYVFATAALNGWFPRGADLALRAGHSMIRNYTDSDAQKGWAFSCTQQGAIVDDRRDLYAHAFVLLALASLLRLDANPRYISLVDRTLTFLDQDMAHPAGGYVEQWPSAVLPRRQNPHMHLLEAFLALQDVGLCGDFSPRIAALVALCENRFITGRTNVLSEFFDEEWRPLDGGRSFEPGHHFEWVWLLTRHAAMCNIDMDERIEGLLQRALSGIDAKGRIVDLVGPERTTAQYRLWSSMEAAKAFMAPSGRTARPSGVADILHAAWQAFLAPSIPGGWIDRIDALGNALVDHMPASSLYHVTTALDYYQRRV